MASQAQVTSESDILWSDGSKFEGYVLLIMAPPNSDGASWTRIALKDSTPRLLVPTRTVIPIKSGEYDSSVKVWKTDSLVPPGVVYSVYFYDSTDRLIAAGAELFAVTADPYVLAPPTLTVPTVETDVPLPESVPVAGSGLNFAAVWHKGEGAPSDSLGRNGDMYFDFATATEGDIYGPKADGTWGSVICNLQGIQGEQGIQGTSGAQGIQGIQGIQGVAGTAGTDGTDAQENLTVIAPCNSTLGLTASFQDVPGATITITRAGVYLVVGVFDWTNSGDNGQNFVGQLVANSVASPAQNIFNSSAATRVTAMQQWVVTASVGHVLKLQALKGGGSGASVVSSVHTTLSATWIHS